MSSSSAFRTYRRDKDLAILSETGSTSQLPDEVDGESRRPVASVATLPPPRKSERSVIKSVRVPVSLLDQLETICHDHRLEFSTLVLHFLQVGVRASFAEEKNSTD